MILFDVRLLSILAQPRCPDRSSVPAALHRPPVKTKVDASFSDKKRFFLAGCDQFWPQAHHTFCSFREGPRRADYPPTNPNPKANKKYSEVASSRSLALVHHAIIPRSALRRLARPCCLAALPAHCPCPPGRGGCVVALVVALVVSFMPPARLCSRPVRRARKPRRERSPSVV